MLDRRRLRLKGGRTARPTFTDLKLDVALIPEPPRPPEDFHVALGVGPWSMSAEAMARAGLEACPVCGGGELRRRDYCGSCDRSGVDGRCSLPGLPVGRYLDPDYKVDGPKYDPAEGLAGGVQKPARLRRGVARSGKRRAG